MSRDKKKDKKGKREKDDSGKVRASAIRKKTYEKELARLHEERARRTPRRRPLVLTSGGPCRPSREEVTPSS
jgi:hypothetical protein